jgi:hypothetical protein
LIQSFGPNVPQEYAKDSQIYHTSKTTGQA